MDNPEQTSLLNKWQYRMINNILCAAAENQSDSESAEVYGHTLIRQRLLTRFKQFVIVIRYL